jgi:outer membrane lipopolysaccharide assembly protein LptE/RlpB
MKKKCGMRISECGMKCARHEGREMKDEGRETRDEERSHPLSVVMVLLALVMLLASCGYRLGGTGGLVPEGARSISVPVFINGTHEPYVDTEVTKAVVNEFLTDGRLQVVSLDSADLALRGKVTKYEVVALSYTVNSYVQQYRATITVDVSLEDLRSKKILWQEKGIQSVFISDYPITYDALGRTDIRSTKIGKEAAIQKASQDIALTLRSRVLEGF